jgi:DNA-binding XRE family transcriptional regulator
MIFFTVYPGAMTKLNQYLHDARISPATLAEKVGATRQRIWELSKGKGLPRVDLAFAIEDATGGAVPARSWVEGS